MMIPVEEKVDKQEKLEVSVICSHLAFIGSQGRREVALQCQGWILSRQGILTARMQSSRRCHKKETWTYSHPQALRAYDSSEVLFILHQTRGACYDMESEFWKEISIFFLNCEVET